MRKYNKLILILIILMLAMTFMLVACVDPSPPPPPPPVPEPENPIVLTNEEMYELARAAHIAVNGYTLKTDSIDKTNPDKEIVLFYHEDVTVADGIATKTTREQKVPVLGAPEGVVESTETLAGYKGTKITANLLLAYLLEGYTCVKEGDIITVTGEVSSVVEMFGSNAVNFKDMSIVIVVDSSKNRITEYTANYTNGKSATTMKYEMKADAIVEA